MKLLKHSMIPLFLGGKVQSEYELLSHPVQLTVSSTNRKKIYIYVQKLG